MEGLEDLVAFFRRLGGKFENAALGYREGDGFFVYTLDSNRDTIISCPSHLLIDVGDVGVNQDGLYIANPRKYKKNIKFLERYVAFHFNQKMLGRYIEKKRQIDSLSSKDLSLISRIYRPDQHWSEGLGEIDFARKQILNTHQITHFGKKVFMPFVTFLNHAKDGASFYIGEDAIALTGKFSNEVFALYNLCDVLGIAGNHGFITDTRFIYSIAMKMLAPDGKQIAIERSLESAINKDGFRWPLVHKGRDVITLSWFPLYFEKDPQYPAKVAQMVACETGLSAEVFLNNIFRANLNVLIPAAFQLRDSGNPFAQLAGAAAQRQLEVISGAKLPT